jgi:hypothetical protein
MLNIGLLLWLLLPARLLLGLARLIPGRLIDECANDRIDLRVRSNRHRKQEDNWQRILDLFHSSSVNLR